MCTHVYLLMQESLVRSHNLLMNENTYWKCSFEEIDRNTGNTLWVGVLKCTQEHKANRAVADCNEFWKNIIWCCSLVDVTPGLGWTTYIRVLCVLMCAFCIMCVYYFVSCPWMFSVDPLYCYDVNGCVTFPWIF